MNDSVSKLLVNLELELGELISTVRDEHSNVWFSATDISKVIGMSNIRSVVRMYDESCKRLFSQETNGGKQEKLFISVDGLKRLLSRSRKKVSSDLAEALGFDVNYTKYTCTESDTIKAIKEVFNGEDMIEQFRVNSYMIDVYMPKFKLAIECDEYNHKFQKDKDDERERDIRKLIPDIQFIRLNPDDKNYNIYMSLNEIYQHITSYYNKS